MPCALKCGFREDVSLPPRLTGTLRERRSPGWIADYGAADRASATIRPSENDGLGDARWQRRSTAQPACRSVSIASFVHVFI
jgi:hypothetical protein